MNSNESTTPLGQRIFLWIIAGLMLFGTIGSFVAMVMANNNQQNDQSRYSELLKEYQDEIAEQEKELSDAHFDNLNKWSSRVSEFKADDITELGHEDLVEGSGEELSSESDFTAYYIGWNPEGFVFDQSIDGDSLKSPIEAYPGGVISGWTEGVAGMKVGGVRELSIPSELAYGEDGYGDDIPPNTPLKFIVYVIPSPEIIEPSQELIDLNKRLVGGV